MNDYTSTQGEFQHSFSKTYFCLMDYVSRDAAILYGAIVSLSRNKGYCYASNKHLAELLRTSPRSIRNWIGELKEANLVEVDIDRTREYQRHIVPEAGSIVPPPPEADCQRGRKHASTKEYRREKIREKRDKSDSSFQSESNGEPKFYEALDQVGLQHSTGDSLPEYEVEVSVSETEEEVEVEKEEEEYPEWRDEEPEAAIKKFNEVEGKNNENIFLTHVFCSLFSNDVQFKYIGRIGKLRNQLEKKGMGAASLIHAFYHVQRNVDSFERRPEKKYMRQLPDRALNYITASMNKNGKARRKSSAEVEQANREASRRARAAVERAAAGAY